MNERIKELAEQAYEQKPLMVANPETFEIEHKIGNGGVPMYHKVFSQEKFAELIVEECISRIEGCAVTTEDDEFVKGYNKGVSKVSSQVKHHFGVE